MSDTVKLIIEIPKTTYEDLKVGKIYSSLCEAPQGVVEGIRDGIPLDDVKSEIEQFREDLAEKAPSLKDLINAQRTVDICLGIIDKYIGGKAE